MVNHNFFCDEYEVAPNVHSRYAAAQRLIRPSEVRHLIRIVPRGLLPILQPAAAVVANVLTRRFRTRELRYIKDPPGRDVWRSPAATFRRGGGDCEDLAIIGMSIFELVGIPAVLVIGQLPTGGHAWVEGQDEAGRFMLEATDGSVTRVVRPAQYRAEQFIGRDFCQLAA